MKQPFAAFVLAFTLAAGAVEPGSNSPAGSGPRTNSTSVSPSRFKADVEQALKEPLVDKRLQRLSDIAEKLSLSEIPEALKTSDGLKELRERMVLKQATLLRWGELASEEAFAYIARLPESQWKVNTLRDAAAKFAQKNPQRAAAAAAAMSPGVSRNDTITLAANLWAQTNATAALAWAEKLPDGAARESALDAIRYVWVHSDPVAASKHVEKLPSGTTKNNLVASVAFEWAVLDQPAAIRWANSLPDGPDKETALSSAAESWANQDPRAAAAFALKLPPGELRALAGSMVAARWARQDPRKAADWAWDSGDAGVRQRGIKEVFDLWAGVDPAECAKWLEHLPAGPDRDEAARMFVTVATMWAPDIAARDALLIENENIRVEALDECLPRWLEVDAAAASRWLNDAKLPDPLKARWRKP